MVLYGAINSSSVITAGFHVVTVRNGLARNPNCLEEVRKDTSQGNSFKKFFSVGVFCICPIASANGPNPNGVSQA